VRRSADIVPPPICSNAFLFYRLSSFAIGPFRNSRFASRKRGPAKTERSRAFDFNPAWSTVWPKFGPNCVRFRYAPNGIDNPSQKSEDQKSRPPKRMDFLGRLQLSILAAISAQPF
jgi:hypothetical protein